LLLDLKIVAPASPGYWVVLETALQLSNKRKTILMKNEIRFFHQFFPPVSPQSKQFC